MRLSLPQWLSTVSMGLIALLSTSPGATRIALGGPTYVDPAKTDGDFAYQGEYSGTLNGLGGGLKIGVQVIALGQGRFKTIGCIGGLPGDGFFGERHEGEGKLVNGAIVISTAEAESTISNGELSVKVGGGDAGTLKKIERKSPTLGEKPPADAIVLFDGSSVDAFEGGKITEDGLLAQGCSSKAKFGDHKVHLEFRTPYQPEDSEQGRGNSGVYLQGRYEVQILDSFGLAGKHNECGGIYSIRDCDVNMCFPPLTWQTYDIEFRAARYGADGALVSKPRITVLHNGVKIHDNVELPADRNTTAAPVAPGPEPGPLYLQDHGNPVRFRNIWVLPLMDEKKP